MKTGNGSKRLVNGEIKANKVTLISEDGKNMGVQSTKIALQVAREVDLDLVQLTDGSTPTVKIMNWSKEKYLEDKRSKKNHKSKADSIKEIRLSIKIGRNDLDTKIRQCKKFLGKGCKVRFNVLLHGREKGRPEEAIELLDEVLSMLDGQGTRYGSIAVQERVVNMMVIPSMK